MDCVADGFSLEPGFQETYCSHHVYDWGTRRGRETNRVEDRYTTVGGSLRYGLLPSPLAHNQRGRGIRYEANGTTSIIHIDPGTAALRCLGSLTA